MEVGKQYDWEYNYTEDGERWSTALFVTLEDARAFASDVRARNEANGRFKAFARHMELVNSLDFHDESKGEISIRIVNR